MPVDETDHRALVGEVEAGEGLIAQQEGRIVGERLSDPEALLLAAGELPDATVGVVSGADGLEEAVDASTVTASGEREPEPMAVDAEGDEVAGAQGGLGRQGTLLRDVSDPAVAGPAHLLTERGHTALAQLLEAEDRPQQGGLARAARPEHGDQLAGLHLEVEPRPQFAAVAPQRRAADLERRRHSVSASAIAATFACIHET